MYMFKYEMHKQTIFQFHGKNVLGSKYVIHWIEVNCPRVVVWMHRNLVHQLTVGFRRLQKKREEKAENETDRGLNTSKFFIVVCNYFAIKLCFVHRFRSTCNGRKPPAGIIFILGRQSIEFKVPSV